MDLNCSICSLDFQYDDDMDGLVIMTGFKKLGVLLEKMFRLFLE